MKTLCIAAPILFGCWACFADTVAPTVTVVSALPVALVVPTNSVTLLAIERGPHHTLYENVLFETNKVGKITASTNRYTELATGLNYKDQNGQWVESKDVIELFNGAAIARQGQTQVIFGTNINAQGSIDMLSPEGTRFRSRILGIACYDPASGKSVLIALTKDSIGQLISANQILYEDAFSNLTADVVYTYHKGSFEQDVILRENPKLPDGFDPKLARFQLWTEFFDPPVPVAQTSVLAQPADPLLAKAMVDPQFIDQKLTFGQMEIGPGKAFSINGQPADAADAVPVGKSWLTIDTRTFLVESVEYNSVKPLLDTLPGVAAIQPNGNKNAAVAKLGEIRVNSRAELARLFPKTPDRKRASLAAGPIKMAKANLAAKPGVVLDYITVSTGTYTTYTFASDSTYYISGTITISSTLIIEGGTVVKFPVYSSSSPVQITIGASGTILCQTAQYKPAIFTGKNDNSVGETVLTGTPSGTYANYALYLQNTSVASSLSNLHIRYAKNGIYYAGGSGHVLSHSQLISCDTAVVPANNTDFTLGNVLISGSGSSTVINGSSSTIIHGENVTIDQCTTLNAGSSSASLNFVNSILVGFASGYSGNPNQAPASGSGVFITAGGGSHYLVQVNNPSYIGAGSSSLINAGLLADLGQRTTMAPTEITSDFSVDTTLSPSVARNVGSPDLGYHYDPIDKVWSGRNLNTSRTLLLTNGVAVAIYGLKGTTLQSGANVVSEGSPVKMNHLVRYNAVQENATSSWNTSGSTMSLFNIAATPATAPLVFLRFTDVALLADTVGKRHLLDAAGYRLNLGIQDCTLRGTYLYVFPTDASQTKNLALTNNLAQRAYFDLSESYITTGYPVNLQLRNNLFLNGTVTLTYLNSYYGTWAMYDNLFDTVSLTASVNDPYHNPLPNGYNGYISTTSLGGSNSKSVTTREYASGPLGTNYYQNGGQPGGNLRQLSNAGSRSASAAGLYHYTVTADQTKEDSANPNVAIGFHYVALDMNNQPDDSDGNGTPDYMADRNGNGITDPGETSFLNPVITLANAPVSYTEKSPPIVLDSAATASDPDSLNLNGGTLTVSQNSTSQPEDRLAIRNQGTASGQIGVSGANVTYSGTVVATFTGGSGTGPLVVTFNANSSPPIAQAVLQNLTYELLSYAPNPLTRTVRLVLTDGKGGTSSPALKTVNITPINDPPQVILSATALNYIIGSQPKVVDVTATVSDVDSTDLAGGRLSVAFSLNGQIDDVLSFQNQGTGAGQIGLSGGNITYGGVTIATYSGGTAASPLVALFNANATPALAQALLRALTYWNSSASPSRLIRNIRVVATDGDGGTSTAALKTINVICPSGIDVILVIDKSGSMSSNNKLVDAKNAAKAFLNYLSPTTDHAGLVSFSDTATNNVALTSNCDSIRSAIDQLTALGETAIGAGIHTAQTELAGSNHNSPAEPVIILLTDGLNNRQPDPETEATNAKNAGTRIITVALGPDAGVELLRLIASSQGVGGDFYAAATGTELATIYTSIAQTLCRAVNQAPVVSAGPDRTLLLGADSTGTLTLNGTVTDDGLPLGGTLTKLWSLVSMSAGGSVVFGSGGAAVTTVTVTQPGIYVLRLSANDGQLSASDDMVLAVFNSGANVAPLVDAGPPQQLVLPSGQTSISTTLNGLVFDDGLPNNTLAITWSVDTQPPNSTVQFGSANLAASTVTVNKVGQYVLHLTANDGQLSASDTVTITVCNVQCPVDVVLLIDKSDSMRETHDLEVFKAAAKHFVDLMASPLNQIALVSFNDSASLDHGLTQDWGAVKSAIDDLQGKLGTVIENGIYTAVDELASYRANPAAKKIIILCTDGDLPADILGGTCVPCVEAALGAAYVAKLTGFRIITVGLRAVGDDLVKRLASADYDFYIAHDAIGHIKAIGDIYTEIAESYCLDPNHRPLVIAGTNQATTLAAGATLSGQASDDGLPGGTLTLTWSMTSGPALGTVSFGAVHSAGTTASFTMAGTYVLRLTADDSAAQGYDELNITVNDPPTVTPGPNQCVLAQDFFLWPTDANDPDYTLSFGVALMWTQVSGPSQANIYHPFDFSTETVVTAPGTYIFRSTVTDTFNNSHSDQTVTVASPLTVSAGKNRTISFNPPSATLALNGVVLACDNSLTVSWTTDSGPGSVVFKDNLGAINNTILNPNATFPSSGTYVLRLTATRNGQTAHSYLTVQAISGTLNAGNDQLIAFGQLATLSGSATDAGGASVSVTWSQVQGPGSATFSDSHSGTATASFSAAGVYVLRLTAANGSADVTISVNQPPIVYARVYTEWTPLPASVRSRIILTGTVSDDNLPANAAISYAWSKVSGPGTVTFSDSTSLFTGAGFSQEGTYELRLSASDSHLTGSTLLTILVVSPPILAPDNYTVLENSVDNLLNVLRNDSDPERSPMTITRIIPYSVLNGTVSVVGGKQLSYTPTPKFFGTDVFQYEVSDGHGGLSQAIVYVYVQFVDTAPVAQNDVFLVPLPSTAYPIDVLANDTDPEGDPLEILSFTQPLYGVLNFRINEDDNGFFTAVLSYTTVGLSDYDDTFTYTITDPFGLTSSATVTLKVSANSVYPPPVAHAQPASQEISPLESATLSGSADSAFYLSFLWTVYSSPPAANVTFYDSSAASTTATFDTLGTYVLKVTATDPFQASSSASLTVNVVARGPVARLLNLANDPARLQADPVVTDGYFALRGVADDSNPANSVAYRMLLYHPSADGISPDTLVANITPGTLNSDGYYHIPAGGRVPGQPGNDALGTLDFTRIRNGTYILELSVHEVPTPLPPTPVTATQRVRFSLASQLKIGNFGFSQQDIVIPINGIPLAVTRTYNSLNPNNGEFGYSWTYAIKDLEVELDEQRQDTIDERGIHFSMRTGGGRNLTLTLPDGRRTTFAFGFRVAPYYAYAEWYAAPGVNATLAPGADNRLVAVLSALTGGQAQFQWQAADARTPMEAYDFPSFTLTTADGTQYVLNRADLGPFTLMDGSLVHPYGPLTLAEIIQPNGNSVKISANGLDHYAPDGTKNCSVSFQRDSTGRITGIRDPLGFDATGNPIGPPAVQYHYYAASDFGGNASDTRIGNLKDVQKVVDRAGNNGNGTYETITYVYGKVVNSIVYFPHFLAQIQDPRGVQPLINQYDDNGVLQSTTDSDGRITTFANDPTADDTGQRKATIIDPLMNKTEHLYDSRGNVTQTSVYDPNGVLQSRVFRTYDDANNLAWESIGSFYNTYGYDPQGNRVSIAPAGNLTQAQLFSYNSLGQPITITDGNGNTTRNEYDPSANGNLLSTTDARGNVTSHTYAGANLDTTTDPLGNKTQYAYYTGLVSDPGGRLGDLKSVTVKEKTVDPQTGQITFVIRNTTSYSYDANGNRATQTITRTLPNGSPESITTTYSYDGQNRLFQTVDALGQSTKTVYNGIGKAATTTDRYGAVTQYFYDLRGNLVQTIYPGNTTAGSPTFTPVTVTRTVYDGDNRPIYSQDRHELPNSGTDSTATGSYTVYDAPGRVTEIHRLQSLTVRIVTDNVTGVTTATLITADECVPPIHTLNYYLVSGVLYQSSRTFASGQIDTAYTDDEVSRQKAVKVYADCYRPLVTSTTYDANWNQVSLIDALGRTTTYEYDELNRRTVTRFPQVAGESAQTTQVSGYDELGRRVSAIDQAGVITRFGYDGLGRLTAVTNNFQAGGPNPFVTQYQYDEAGNLTQQTDANGHTTKFEYDKLGRRTKRTLPGPKSGNLPIYETFSYDPPGNGGIVNQQTHTDFNGSGKTTTLLFDPLGRLRQKTPDVLFNAAPIQFDFYAGGERKTMIDASGTTTYAYDAQRQLLSKTWTQGALTYTLKYGHNELGRLTGITNNTPGGTSVAYDWNCLAQMASVTDHLLAAGAQMTSYDYDDVGNLLDFTEPNAVKTSYVYNELNRLKSMSVAAGATTLASCSYTLRPAGNRAGVVESGSGINTGARTVAYGYDNLYRLTSETISGDSGGANGTAGYTYDNVGNRLARASTISPLASTSASYDANDRMGSVTYDDAGNTKVEALPAPAISPTTASPDLYDFENRLLNRNNGQVQIVYDGDGNRVQETASGATTYYVVDDQNPTGYAQVLEELTRSGSQWTVQRVYTFGQELISQNAAGTVRYYGYDGHGNVRFLTDGNQTVKDTYLYDAFGLALHTSETTVNSHRYCGEQYDAALGLYYNRARYLNPNSGRFWTMDSFEGNTSDPLSLHKYLYAHANPVMMTDPSGQFSLGEITITTAIRATLFTLNVAGAISNAKQTARYSVAAFEAISDDDPWNATLSIAGAVMHGGLTALNVLGAKSFISSIGPPPAGGFAVAGGGTLAVGRVWQFALSNPAAKKWVFEEFIPVVGTGIGLFASSMGHEAQWEHRDSGGKIKARGTEESGSEGTSPGRLDFNEQLQTHTEWKLLSEISGLKQGDIITIRGDFPPCNPGGRGCFSVMEEFAKRNQVKVIYKMTGGQAWVFE